MEAVKLEEFLFFAKQQGIMAEVENADKIIEKSINSIQCLLEVEKLNLKVIDFEKLIDQLSVFGY